MRGFITILSIAMLLPQLAFATSVGINPGAVTKGLSIAEARISVTSDENAARDEVIETRQHFDYGFTDYFAFRVVAFQNRVPGDSFRHNDWRVEARFQLFDEENDGFTGGFNLEYFNEDNANNSDDQLRLRLAGSDRYEDWEFRSNVIVSHAVGGGTTDGLGAQWRWRATHPLAGVNAALEGLHNFGNLNETNGFETQGHFLGFYVLDSLLSDFAPGWSYQTGYQLGVSQAAPDHNFIFFLTKRF